MGASPITRAPRFSNLRDVDLSGLADGDAMLWNASTGKWEPGAAGGVNYAASGAGTANRVQMSNASGELVDSIIRQGSVASNFPEITSTNTNVTITTSEQFVLTSYRSSPGASLLLSINYAGLNKKTHIGSSSTPDRMFQVTDNSGNPQRRSAYDATHYLDEYVDATGNVVTLTTTGDSANNTYLRLAASGGGYSQWRFEKNGANIFSYLQGSSNHGIRLHHHLTGCRIQSTNTAHVSLGLDSDGTFKVRNSADSVLFDVTNAGAIGFFGATPTANPVTRYGLSGAGTENYVQVPNASGELINVPLTVTEASGTATIQNPGGGTKFTFRTDRLGIYHGITGRGRWTSAGFMFGVDSNPERMVEVRDNSGNPQFRFAYDAFNYGEVQINSTGQEVSILTSSSSCRFKLGGSNTVGNYSLAAGSGNTCAVNSLSVGGQGGANAAGNNSLCVGASNSGGSHYSFAVGSNLSTGSYSLNFGFQNTVGSYSGAIGRGITAADNEFHFGSASYPMSLKVSSGFSVFGTTLVTTQPAHIADADGTLSGNQTAINAVIAALEAYGLLAAS